MFLQLEIKISDFFGAIKGNLQVHRKSRRSALLKFAFACDNLVFHNYLEIKISDFFGAIKGNLQVHRKSRRSALLKFAFACGNLGFRN